MLYDVRTLLLHLNSIQASCFLHRTSVKYIQSFYTPKDVLRTVMTQANAETAKLHTLRMQVAFG